ncbi:MAG: threonine synthase [Enterobacterales bacterium]
MKLYNINKKSEEVSFTQAIKQGIGSNQGLFFPSTLPEFNKKEIGKLLKMDFINRSVNILLSYFEQDFSYKQIFKWVKSSFNFPIKTVKINNKISILELFHGPTLAFKDFGSRFMAQILNEINDNKLVILTATSGDTGAAVAHAFYGMKNISVVILYPKDKVSKLQESLFSTLGRNIYSISINSNFDTCQYLVKKSFLDKNLNKQLHLNSANSINISRIIAQICYYFEAVSQLPKKLFNNIVVSVPSGNFGNLTAGLLAKSMGLPIKRFIASTNINNTVPRFLESGYWDPKDTITTLANSMDVSCPNNWPRIEEIFRHKKWNFNSLDYGFINDKKIIDTIYNVKYKNGYILEPHSAIAYNILCNKLKNNEYGLCLGTAHPSKFKNSIEKIINQKIILPKILKIKEKLPFLSKHIKPEFKFLKEFLLKNICK